MGRLADLNWLELDLERMGSGTWVCCCWPRSRSSWREDGCGGEVGTVAGIRWGLRAWRYWGLNPPLEGGLSVSLLGLTGGPPFDKFDSSWKSEWEITEVGTEVERAPRP